jgi:hypothetical protein
MAVTVTCSLEGRARINGVKPETVWAMERAKEVMYARGYPCYFVSVTDGEHQDRSLHYVGQAFDFAIVDIPPDEVSEIKADLEDAMGVEFDIVPNIPRKIIHVEFQPEKGLNL